MSALKFRNITTSVDDPVETWPFEGILAAVERGTLPDWRRLAAAVRAAPWGPVAQQVHEAIEMSRPYGTTELLTAVIERARQDAADAERDEVAREIRNLVTQSGLSQQDFALRIGTSRPRLSTYMSGKVTPSAALMLRIRRAAVQTLPLHIVRYVAHDAQKSPPLAPAAATTRWCYGPEPPGQRIRRPISLAE